MAIITKNKIIMTNNATLNDLRTKMFGHLKSILDRYMKQFPDNEELIAFMEDENQMYDANGRLTEEYNNWIRKFNEFCKNHPIEFKEDELDSNKIEVLEGVKDFLSKQKELISSYRNSSNKDEWLNEVLDTKEKRDAFDRLIEESSNNAINEFEDTIQKNKGA